MLISINQIRKDYLALLGESPCLSPLLEEGEDSAVLTLEQQLHAALLPAAVEATLATDALFHDEVQEIYPPIKWNAKGIGTVMLPADYLQFYSLQMPDWPEPVWQIEPAGSLRRSLGGNAPSWMACQEHPMVTEGRNASGRYLRIRGSAPTYEEVECLIYIPKPKIEGDSLRISAAAYPTLLQSLIGLEKSREK